jgi:hypothetical protein
MQLYEASEAHVKAHCDHFIKAGADPKVYFTQDTRIKIIHTKEHKLGKDTLPEMVSVSFYPPKGRGPNNEICALILGTLGLNIVDCVDGATPNKAVRKFVRRK